MWQLGWMFSLIPDSIFVWVTYILMAIGAGLYVASKLVTWIPMMGQYKLPSEVIGVVVLCIGTYMFGSYGTEMIWRERVKVVEDKVAAAEKRADEATAKVEIKIVEKVKVVEKRVEVVRKEIQIQKEIINAQCTVNDVAVDLYNKAVSDPEDNK